MSLHRTHGWCPACREESAIDGLGSCLWCGGPTRERRPSVHPKSRYSYAQIQALEAAHANGASVDELALQTYRKVGYRSVAAAAMALEGELRRLGTLISA